MTATATGRTVQVGPFEATAIGNTLTQAIAAGDIADIDELRRVVSDSFELQLYEPESSAGWLDAYERFLKLLDGEV